MRIKMIILVAFVLVLAACLPGQDQADVQSQVNTAVAQAMETSQRQIEESVALTVAAQQVELTLAADQPVLTEEPVLELTSTPTLEIPTLAPLIPTNTPIANNPPRQPPAYACNAINRKPVDNTEFNRNAKFDIKWTIVNTGTQTWPAGTDVKYLSGPHMSTVDRVEIPKEMKPNDTYVVNLDAKAPDKKGFFVMTWTLDGQMCYPYVAINVK